MAELLSAEERDNIEHAVKRGVQGCFLTNNGDPLWEGLVERGLAKRRHTINDDRDRYYQPTEAGKAALKGE